MLKTCSHFIYMFSYSSHISILKLLFHKPFWFRYLWKLLRRVRDVMYTIFGVLVFEWSGMENAGFLAFCAS